MGGRVRRRAYTGVRAWERGHRCGYMRACAGGPAEGVRGSACAVFRLELSSRMRIKFGSGPGESLPQATIPLPESPFVVVAVPNHHTGFLNPRHQAANGAILGGFGQGAGA